MATDTSIKVAAAAASLDAGWALLSSSDRVTYVTGSPVPIETGESPFAGGPSLALVGPDGDLSLVASNLESWLGADVIDELHVYVGFSAHDPEPQLQHYLEAVTAALDSQAVSGRLAVELASLPAGLAALLAQRGIEVVDAHAALQLAQMIKTPRELVLLRESAAVAAIGQRAAVAHASVGMTELHLFSLIRLAMEEAAGGRIAVAGDLLSGSDRSAGVAGWPTNRRLGAGDAVIADIAPRVAGYWADSCNTFVVGSPSRGLVELHRSARRALEAGIAVARPGTPVSEIDAAVRSTVDSEFAYEHHTGHSIGTSVHEFPRIIQGEHTLLQPGMVILLEPGLYRPGVGGVRLEWMFEVTDDGVALLTDFHHDLEPI